MTVKYKPQSLITMRTSSLVIHIYYCSPINTSLKIKSIKYTKISNITLRTVNSGAIRIEYNHS